MITQIHHIAQGTPSRDEIERGVKPFKEIKTAFFCFHVFLYLLVHTANKKKS